MKALIAGGGVGGVTAACCLLRAGCEVELYEQAPVFGEIGAGIQVSPNAARVLKHVGAFEEVEAVAARPKAYRFRLHDSGEVLQTIPFGAAYEARHGVPYLTVHRADLMAALARSLSALDPGAARFGETVAGYETTPEGVRLHLAERTAEGDALIGADGVRSVIRAAMLGPTPARYTGQAAWRIAVPAEAVGGAPDTVDIWVGPGRHAVTYPLRRGEIVNMVGAVRRDSWDEESWTTPRPWEELDADFAGWHPQIRALIKAAPRDGCFRWALFDRDPAETWTDGPVALLGDAAHPTLPYLAQGAAMAMEDGALVARALAAGPDTATALRRYRDARFERTSRVVMESRANAGLFQMPSADAVRAAFAKRDMNAERNAWLFSYDALAAPVG